jgi:hypothetical protein
MSSEPTALFMDAQVSVPLVVHAPVSRATDLAALRIGPAACGVDDPLGDPSSIGASGGRDARCSASGQRPLAEAELPPPILDAEVLSPSLPMCAPG